MYVDNKAEIMVNNRGLFNFEHTVPSKEKDRIPTSILDPVASKPLQWDDEVPITQKHLSNVPRATVHGKPPVSPILQLKEDGKKSLEESATLSQMVLKTWFLCGVKFFVNCGRGWMLHLPTQSMCSAFRSMLQTSA